MNWLPKDYWRAIILYGQNAATYKIALAQCLAKFVKDGKTDISMQRLATDFFDLYLERLKSQKPQLMLPHRLTVMERIVANYNVGLVTRENAISRVKIEAFNDVIPRFHTIDREPIPVQFYEHSSNGLKLDDSLFEIFTNDVISQKLEQEIDARWSLLEAAFAIRREKSTLINDLRHFYLSKGYARTNITHTIPVLNGYQQDICFYCGEQMQNNDINVDHVIPRQFIQHDEIWNLVLVHRFCNQQKQDALPSNQYIEKLIERNEHFIASNHPIKEKLIAKLGKTSELRKKCIDKVYQDAKTVIGYTWEGIKGYNPATDPFYKAYVRRKNR
jgi:hypothetical protein